MKFLTDRQEIARAMNFGKYPVLYLNYENRPYADSTYDGDYAVGCRVKCAWNHPNPRYAGMTTHGKLYTENGRIKISGEGGCLHADFGYHDVIEMQEEARVPIVNAGQTVIVVEDWPSRKNCRVRVMKIGDYVDTNCMVACSLHDVEEAFEI